MNKVVLGKGLDALLASNSGDSGENKKYKVVPIDSLAPNSMQPRKDFDDTALLELSESIKQNGIIQPLVVQENGSGYMIIAGERRYRASKLADLKQLPVIIIDKATDLKKLELALIENIQRENLNVIETAEAYKSLIEKFEYTQQQLSDRVGKSRTSVANQMRLLTLPPEIKEMVRSRKLSEGHGRALLSIDSELEQIKFAKRIISDSLTVRVTEDQTSKKRKTRRLIPKKSSPEMAEAETKLKQLMGTSVKIIPGLKRSRIEIEYYGVEDLNRILELLGAI